MQGHKHNNVKNANKCYCDTTLYIPVCNVVLDIKWMHFNAVVSEKIATRALEFQLKYFQDIRAPTTWQYLHVCGLTAISLDANLL